MNSEGEFIVAAWAPQSRSSLAWAPSPTGGAEHIQPHLAEKVDLRSSLLGFGRVGGNLERKRKQARLGGPLAAGQSARQQNGVFHVARIGLVPADQIEGGPVVHRGADNR